jgi:hypothetical protein
MAAEIQKNQVTASLRQIDLIVSANGYGAAPRGTNFIALGILFVPDASNLPHYKLGTGTCVNKRRPLVVADDVFTATAGTDQLNAVAHGLETGDGPVRVANSGGALPAPLAAGTDYFVIKVDADNFKLAADLPSAYANTPIDITTNGTGTQTLSDTASTQRGLDGKFTYTPTQAEVNQALNEFSVLIEGTGFANAEGGGAYSTAAIVSGVADIWDRTSGDGHTNQQKLNLAARFAAAPFSKADTDYQWRKLDDSGDSHSFTVTGTGRSDVDITDPD